MPLSEATKLAMQQATDLTVKFCGIAELQKRGPKKFIDSALADPRSWTSIGKNLAENREEAESYLAGLFGMM